MSCNPLALICPSPDKTNRSHKALMMDRMFSSSSRNIVTKSTKKSLSIMHQPIPAIKISTVGSEKSEAQSVNPVSLDCDPSGEIVFRGDFRSACQVGKPVKKVEIHLCS